MAGTYARTCDALVVGGGPAGYVGAIRLGQLGRKVILVERRELGGECLNRGCIPSKALLHAGGLYYAAGHEGPDVGVVAKELTFDLAATQRWKAGLVAKERQGVTQLLKSAGVEVLVGEARFTGPRSVSLVAPDGGQERIDFGSALIATGSVPVVLPGFEPDGRTVFTAEQLLDVPAVPRSILVLGGGVSGCELGEFLAMVGTRVTIVELLPQLLPGLEPDLSREITGALVRLGVEVRTATKALKLARSADGVTLEVAGPTGTTEKLAADGLFLTVGKRPASRDLGLEEAGVAVDPKTGFVPVDPQQRTNVPTIYAAGDVCRPPMLAHKAYREGTVAAEAIAGRPTRFDFQAIPSVVFTTPELATVGLTAEMARSQGLAVREARFPFAALGRAHAAHATTGWLKIVATEPDARLVGVHAAGASVGEFVAEAGLAIEMGATVRDVALTIHPHPTFSETLQEAALLWLGEPMHVARRGGGGRPA
ncbi:MAG TPA: dihydrolipoyl dehydrogenase [Thermoplasmata archaeon]|nr:dihydrolipoyl dehydrogenase [Thermoplasmata archaeon]